jgi:hypothetical protein
MAQGCMISVIQGYVLRRRLNNKLILVLIKIAFIYK